MMRHPLFSHGREPNSGATPTTSLAVSRDPFVNLGPVMTPITQYPEPNLYSGYFQEPHLSQVPVPSFLNAGPMLNTPRPISSSASNSVANPALGRFSKPLQDKTHQSYHFSFESSSAQDNWPHLQQQQQQQHFIGGSALTSLYRPPVSYEPGCALYPGSHSGFCNPYLHLSGGPMMEQPREMFAALGRSQLNPRGSSQSLEQVRRNEGGLVEFRGANSSNQDTNCVPVFVGAKGSKDALSAICFNCKERGLLARYCAQSHLNVNGFTPKLTTTKQVGMSSVMKQDSTSLNAAKDDDMEWETDCVTCYRCSELGHVAMNCPAKLLKAKDLTVEPAITKETGSVICYKCDEEGHCAKNCPLRLLKAKGSTVESSIFKKTGLCFRCDGEGHYASDCPLRLLKTKGSTSLNVPPMEYDVSDTDGVTACYGLSACREDDSNTCLGEHIRNPKRMLASEEFAAATPLKMSKVSLPDCTGNALADPSSIEKSDILADVPVPKIDINMLVNTIHNLSELLLAGSNMDQLKEVELEVLKNAVNNMQKVLLMRSRLPTNFSIAEASCSLTEPIILQKRNATYNSELRSIEINNVGWQGESGISQMEVTSSTVCCKKDEIQPLDSSYNDTLSQMMNNLLENGENSITDVSIHFMGNEDVSALEGIHGVTSPTTTMHLGPTSPNRYKEKDNGSVMERYYILRNRDDNKTVASEADIVQTKSVTVVDQLEQGSSVGKFKSDCVDGGQNDDSEDIDDDVSAFEGFFILGQAGSATPCSPVKESTVVKKHNEIPVPVTIQASGMSYEQEKNEDTESIIARFRILKTRAESATSVTPTEVFEMGYVERKGPWDFINQSEKGTSLENNVANDMPNRIGDSDDDVSAIESFLIFQPPNEANMNPLPDAVHASSNCCVSYVKEENEDTDSVMERFSILKNRIESTTSISITKTSKMHTEVFDMGYVEMKSPWYFINQSEEDISQENNMTYVDDSNVNEEEDTDSILQRFNILKNRVENKICISEAKITKTKMNIVDNISDMKRKTPLQFIDGFQESSSSSLENNTDQVTTDSIDEKHSEVGDDYYHYDDGDDNNDDDVSHLERFFIVKSPNLKTRVDMGTRANLVSSATTGINFIEEKEDTDSVMERFRILRSRVESRN